MVAYVSKHFNNSENEGEIVEVYETLWLGLRLLTSRN